MPRTLHLLTIIGARPQIIKASAISRAVATRFPGKIRETLLHTGQHYDAAMSKVFFDELGIPRPEVDLAVGSGSHGTQTARMIEGIEKEILDRRPDVVLLYGDTNSTLAGAVASSKLNVPVAHVEAGLRSFNKAMPEEVNRIVSDHCSTWLFCPTDTAVANLEREGLARDMTGSPTADRPRVQNVGDVMYDNSLHFASLAEQRSTILKDLDAERDGYVLVTIHRNGNTDDPVRLKAIVQGLIDLSDAHDLRVVFPVHPRTKRCMEALPDAGLIDRLAGLPKFHMLGPASFLDMIALEKNARMVITDSGGVQKEAHFFDRPCIILRQETEWVELVDHGRSVLVDADPERMAKAVERALSNELPTMPAIFGRGEAAATICDSLLN